MRALHGWMAAFGITLTLSAGCGAGKVARPDDPTYAGAAGETKKASAICHAPDAEGSPLIVDWKPEDRGDLEVAMRQGVAAVHYDCDAVRLLPDCHAEGNYGFIGITRKEQVISLADADEAKANLPMNGGTIGASLARGAALDIGLIMVGKSTASLMKVEKSALQGRCDGATHFIRSATLGAFAMKTRASGQVGAAASLFGVGASADSSSNKSVDNKEGDVAACQQSDIDAPKAPKNCGAPLRVQLVALGHELDEKAAQKELSCPQGTVLTAGKCAAPKADAPHECKMDDIPDCTKQCDAGDAPSCGSLALATLLAGLNENTTKYDALTIHGFQRGCDLDDMASCTQLGDMYRDGTALPKPDLIKARQIYAKACGGGNGGGCRGLAKMTTDKVNAAALLIRGCNAGDGASCAQAGQLFSKGDGVAPDATLAKKLYLRGCGLHDKNACRLAK